MRTQNQVTVYVEKGGSPFSGFIYIWKNTKTCKYYIGSHMGNVHDGYVGSGSHFKNAFRKEKQHFRRRILEYVCGDYYKLIERENYWLGLIKEKKGKFYNLSYTSTGLHTYDYDSILAMKISKKNRKWYTLVKIG